MNMKTIATLLSPVRTMIAVAYTAFCSAVGIVAMVVFRRDGDWVMWNVGRVLWSRPLLRWIVGAQLDIDVHPDSLALADRRKGMVLVANHASFLDINAAFAASPTPIVFLSKASVRKVPLLGRLNELAGTVFVERGNRASSEKAVHQLTETLKLGRSVLVFPEGTRSATGKLMPFKKGAIHLAKAASAPLVPMHISGTWERLSPGQVLIAPSRMAIRVRIGAPLDDLSLDVQATLTEAKRAVERLGIRS